MTFTCAVGIAMLIAGLPLAAAAQSPAPSTDLQIQTKQRRSVVLPKPTPEQVRQDADTAVSEFAATRNPGQVVRETSPLRPPGRPDLNYDVTGGIQTRQLNDALRK
jgi:hypothetical protein